MDFAAYCLNSIQNIFEKFIGCGFVFVLLVVIIAVISGFEKNPKIRTFFVTYPLYVLIVFFCPLWWAYIYFIHDEEILYRIFWLLPMGLIIVYGFVKFAGRFESWKLRAFSFALGCILIIASGKYLYASPIYTRAENEYHIDETVVKICDEIIVEGREISCCFPDEMISYVRQYTPFVCMPYGRDMLFNRYQGEEELRSIMNSETIDTEALCGKLKATNTAYLVLSEDAHLTEGLSEYGYIYVTTIDDYDIFLDNDAYIGLDFVDYR